MRVLLPCLLSVTFFAGTVQSSAQTQHISGRIIAYAKPLACLNGNAYWAMIIHVLRPRRLGAEFIKVSFSLPCEKRPDWLMKGHLPNRFDLVRDKNSDEVLTEFMQALDPATGQRNEHETSLPTWIRTPGTERERLPFGKVVPSYRWAALPLAPVV